MVLRQRLSYSFIALLLGFFLVSANIKFHPIQAANDVTIQVNPGKVISVIKPYAIGGINVNNSMIINKNLKMIEPLHIPSIVYPAGNIGDEPEKNVYSDYALRAFKLQQSYLKNPHTMIALRLFNAKPEDAAAVVKYCKDNKIRVDIWAIGNEPDLYGPHRGDKSWTPEKYAKVFREFAAAVKKVDPKAKIVGPMVSQPYDGWILTFIKECGDIVDVLGWHWYPTGPSADSETALTTAEYAGEMVQRYREYLTDPETNPKGYQRTIELGINEYAIHWNSQMFRHLTDMVGALWTAEVMGQFALNGVDYSHYFCLGAYGGHAMFEDPPSYMERPVYYSFLFYANHFGREMIPATSSDDLVRTFASKNGKGKTYVMVMNQSSDETKTLRIKLDGITSIKKLEGFILTEERLGENMTGDELKAMGDEVQLTLPPYSLMAIEID